MSYANTKRWRENNPEKLREIRLRAYWRDVERSRERLVEYRRKNRDKINQRRRENYAQNAEVVRCQVQEYRDRNREAINEKRRLAYRERNAIKMRGVFRFVRVKKEYTEFEVVNATEAIIQNAVDDFVKRGGVIEKVETQFPIMGINRVNTKISNTPVPAGFYEVEV